ncbi:hypothetical protein I317_05305 [Kwoniella heveanensis CBS 569]|nr:hypothetical protein I317_05305 [Kwoniella heveanensis CBS 569]
MWINYSKECANLSAESRRAVLLDIHQAITWHTSVWSSPAEGLTGTEREFLMWYDNRMLISVKFEMLEICLPSERTIAVSQLIELIGRFVQQTKSVSANGSLVFLQDITAVYFSSLAAIVYKLFWKLNPGQKRMMVDAIKEIHGACSESANGDINSPSAFVARFYTRLLYRLNTQSRALSRAQSPSDIDQTPAANCTPDEREVELATDIDMWIQQLGDLEQSYPTFDQSYWSTLSSVPLATFEQIFE